ncbi:MAG TPA: hypothetical protein VE462_14450 [Propionibacteriaceae bacterium]|jgi:hypothetical protein|nr:hypothetical protein [Propionibacteriaceae bacterium]
MIRRVDVVALVLGIVLTAVAALSLWAALVGSINWGIVQIVAPLGLVATGIVGLALSRNRT